MEKWLTGASEPENGLMFRVTSLEKDATRRGRLLWGAAGLGGTALLTASWDAIKKKLGLS